MSEIPIANVYYLLLYAWRHTQQRELVDLSGAAGSSLPNLFANVLESAVARLIARGLDRSYVLEPQVVAGVRGKLDVAVTARRQLEPIGRTYCHVDELRHDVLHNRIIKATLRQLLALDNVDPGIRERVRRLYGKLDAVGELSLASQHFRGVQLHRNVRAYDFILRVCRLIYESTVLDPETGSARFYDFRRDARMWQVFEDFLLEFYRLEQRQYRVGRPRIEWFEAEGQPHDLTHLPGMQTDIVLQSSDDCIIIDAKYYAEALSEHFGSARLKSAHLYQLFTYLENRTAALPDLPHRGILLYPVVGAPFSFDYRLKGHRVSVRSIDLRQPWARIHRDMLSIIRAP